jgi:hypothetical protein
MLNSDSDSSIGGDFKVDTASERSKTPENNYKQSNKTKKQYNNDIFREPRTEEEA